jgi:hypothetical protein
VSYGVHSVRTLQSCNATANVCVVFRKGDMSEDALRRSALARENVLQANEFGQTMQASLRKSARRSSL